MFLLWSILEDINFTYHLLDSYHVRGAIRHTVTQWAVLESCRSSEARELTSSWEVLKGEQNTNRRRLGWGGPCRHGKPRVDVRPAWGPVRGLICRDHGGAVSILLGKREWSESQQRLFSSSKTPTPGNGASQATSSTWISKVSPTYDHGTQRCLSNTSRTCPRPFGDR